MRLLEWKDGWAECPCPAAEYEMSIQRPERGILDRIADAMNRLLGRKTPVLVPVTVRRSRPIQFPIERRLG